eukprot:6198346-Pleurochrysis_carterae.AAC.3
MHFKHAHARPPRPHPRASATCRAPGDSEGPAREALHPPQARAGGRAHDQDQGRRERGALATARPCTPS